MKCTTHVHTHITSLFVLLVMLFSASLISAWVGPTASPPSGNVPAPVHVGSTSQIKNGSLGINALAVFGNAIFSGDSLYLNFGNTAGSTGYGIRDNEGVMEFRDANGTWTAFADLSDGVGGGGGSETYDACSAETVSGVGSCPETEHLGYCTVTATTQYSNTCGSEYCTGANIDGKAQCLDGTWNVVNTFQQQQCYQYDAFCDQGA